MEDVIAAQKNRSVIINFSTTPQWMWNTPAPVAVPYAPDTPLWGYTQGNDLRDDTMQTLHDYYKRLVSWYTNGGFTDEYGVYHKSGHFFNIPMWEVLNEVESEHRMTPQYYTRIYDAIVTGILEVQPNMTFVGLALEGREPSWVTYFLNISNHISPTIPLDWISYHFYATPNQRTNITLYESFFPQADSFFVEVDNMEQARIAMNPSVKTTIDEIGVILPNDNDADPIPIPDIYWNAAGAMFAYIFGNLANKGIDVLGESQLVGYPTQYPSVSLMDWVTALPNSRYWVLYLLHQNFAPGDKILSTTVSSNTTFAQGFITSKGKAILVINKTLLSQELYITGMQQGTLHYVDETTFESPPSIEQISGPTVLLSPFAVGVLYVNS